MGGWMNGTEVDGHGCEFFFDGGFFGVVWGKFEFGGGFVGVHDGAFELFHPFGVRVPGFFAVGLRE